MKYFKEEGPIYNLEHPKGESVSEFLSIDIMTLDEGGFQFYQTGLIQKVLESTGMEHCNGLPTPTNTKAHHGTDMNGSEAKRDWPNFYGSVIGMMLDDRCPATAGGGRLNTQKWTERRHLGRKERVDGKEALEGK